MVASVAEASNVNVGGIQEHLANLLDEPERRLDQAEPIHVLGREGGPRRPPGFGRRPPTQHGTARVLYVGRLLWRDVSNPRLL
jgi:hypothetical protein